MSVMSEAVMIAVVGLMQAVAVAIITGLYSREAKSRKKSDEARKRSDEAAEKRAAVRAEESHLSMQLLSACVSLGVATAIAVQERKVNGEMTSALKEAENAKREYYQFVNRVAAENIQRG